MRVRIGGDRLLRRHWSPKILVLATLLVVGGSLQALSAHPALASGTAPDNCTQPERTNNPWFTASGPLQYWFWYYYSGGPANPYAPVKGDACMIWTYNEASYSGPSTGNLAAWWDVGSMTCSCGYDNSALAWIPSEDATTTHAEYQMWSGTSYEGTCVVNQDAYYNQWVQLCGSTSFQLYSEADVLMTDGTGEPSGTKQIGWDALNFGYVVTV
jgi:hypothetical protein